jgi:hypothetical protein
MIVMGVYWATEALPLAATALLPAVLFPLANVTSTKEMCDSYFNQSNMLFLGKKMDKVREESSSVFISYFFFLFFFSFGSPCRWVDGRHRCGGLESAQASRLAYRAVNGNYTSLVICHGLFMHWS